jgi:hypothetical protein
VKISSGPSKPDAVGLVERLKKLRERDVECSGKPVQQVEGGRLPAPFQIRQVGLVHRGAARQFLLRDPEALPQFLDPRPERRPQVVHAGIVPSGSLPQP